MLIVRRKVCKLVMRLRLFASIIYSSARYITVTKPFTNILLPLFDNED